MKIPLTMLYEMAEKRPEQYLADCLAAGKISDGFIEWDQKTYSRLCRKYRRMSLNAEAKEKCRQAKCKLFSGFKCKVCGCYEFRTCPKGKW